MAASKYDETDELTLQSGLHYQAIKGEFSMFFHGNAGADGTLGGIGILVDGQFRDAGYVNYNTVSIGGDISYRTVPSLVGSGPGTYYTIPNEKLDWVTFHGRRNHAK